MQHLSEVPSPLANMKECSPSAADDYHLLENSLVFQQPQIPNLFSQVHIIIIIDYLWMNGN